MRWLALAFLVACTADTVPPRIVTVTPTDGADLVGAGMVIVNARISDDRGFVASELLVDGVLIDQHESDACENTCVVSFTWPTVAVPAGEHELQILAHDGNDNTVADLHTVFVDDLVEVTALEVTNTVDESGTLEIAIYAFADDSGAHFGCAGTAQGMGPVDASDMRYALEAVLIDPISRLPMAASSFASVPARFEIWEDDDDPVCPTVPLGSGNNLVGASPALTAADVASRGKLAFGNVVELSLEFGRPLTLDDTPEPPPPPGGDEDPFDDAGGGAAGCNAGGAAGLGIALALAFLRRRRASPTVGAGTAPRRSSCSRARAARRRSTG